MTRSVFYNLASAEGERAIARLRELGGRVAHHAVWPRVDLDDRFEPVVAWHNPDPEYMTAPIAGAVNVMSAPWFDPGHYRSGLEPALAPRLPARGARARASSSGSSSSPIPRSGPSTGATMRETMQSFLDADRAARLEQLRADRIDLA